MPRISKKASNVELTLEDDDESGLSAHEKSLRARKAAKSLTDVDALDDLSLITPVSKKTRKSIPGEETVLKTSSPTKSKTKASPKKRVVKSAEVIELSSDDAKDDPNTVLAPGDSMFPEKKASRVHNTKASISSPSPLKTRSSSGIHAKRVLDDQADNISALEDNDEFIVVSTPSKQRGPARLDKSPTKIPDEIKKAPRKRVVVESDGSESDQRVEPVAQVRDLRSPKKKARPAPASPSDVEMASERQVDDAVNGGEGVAVFPDELPSSDDELPESPTKPTKLRREAEIGQVVESKPRSVKSTRPVKVADIFDNDTNLADEEIILADPDVVFPGQAPPNTPIKSKGKGVDRRALPVSEHYDDMSEEFIEFPDMPQAMMLSREDADELKKVKARRDGRTNELSSSSKAPSESMASKKLGGRSFAEIVKATSKGSTKNTTMFLQDVNGHKVSSLPEECQVTKSELQDAFLVSTYEGLPNLLTGIVSSWNDSSGPGQILYTAWADQCPGMSYDAAFSAVTFQQSGRYLNPSCASPLNAYSVHTSTDGSRSVMYTGKSVAILVSSVFSVVSHLITIPDRGLAQHYISGIFHSQEWERFCAFMCMVFGHPELTAQLSLDALTFSTKAVGKSGDLNPKSPGPSNMFSKVESPATKRGSQSFNKPGSIVKSVLEFNDQIPVYDARDQSFDINKDIDRMNEILPPFDGEIPQGSFVVVGYTSSIYKGKAGRFNMSCNIQWAILIGTPEGF